MSAALRTVLLALLSCGLVAGCAKQQRELAGGAAVRPGQFAGV